MQDEITIRLDGQPTTDGRTYVTSPDFWGFHYVLEQGEEVTENLVPLLMEFVARKLEIEIRDMRPALSPRDVWARKHAVPKAGQAPAIPDAFIAAVA